jgi:protease-4
VRRAEVVFLLLLSCAGCLRPLQTDSHVTFDRPVSAMITASLEAKHNSNPLVAMPVDGQLCCPRGPKVAIIDVDGVLVNQDLTGLFSTGENPVDVFREKLDAAAADPGVCAVVVRINSPGGGVTATDLMWRELQTFRIKTKRPVVACLMDLGCGGAYYLATASDLILAHPTTVTGGIGVVLNLYNLRDFMGTFNVVSQSIKAGPNIDMGSAVAPLTQESKRLLQTMADEFHQRFRAVVQQQRPQVEAAEGTTFDGRVFTAQQALERHLVDRIGYLEDAITAAGQLAGEPEARPVLFHRCNDVARTPFATTPHVPLQSTMIPVSIPGVERSRLPTFLYMWEPDPTLERLGNK